MVFLPKSQFQNSEYRDNEENIDLGIVGQAKRVVLFDSSGNEIITSSGFAIPAYDNIIQIQATLTDTWTFRSGSTVVATITITYTGADKEIISTVVRS